MSPPSPPPTPRIRDSLLARADRITVFPLTLVGAPAGSGKSTLLGAWRRRLAELGETTAYLDLSPLHADASVLCADLLEVMRHVAPGFGAETTRRLANASSEADEWRQTAARLPAGLEQRGQRRVAGTRQLPRGRRRRDRRALHRRAAARTRFLASTSWSRVAGPSPDVATRLRAAGVVQEVDDGELSLRFDEVERVLAEHGAAGDPDLATRVLARTEGWATGVQLAARRLSRSIPPRVRSSWPDSPASRICSASSRSRCCATSPTRCWRSSKRSRCWGAARRRTWSRCATIRALPSGSGAHCNAARCSPMGPRSSCINSGAISCSRASTRVTTMPSDDRCCAAPVRCCARAATSRARSTRSPRPRTGRPWSSH